MFKASITKTKIKKMDKQKINTYILFLIHRFNKPQNSYESTLKITVDQWRRWCAQEVLFSVLDDIDLFTKLNEMYESEIVLVGDFKNKKWYYDDQSLIDMTIKPLRDKVVTPKEISYVAKLLRILYFPEFMCLNNNMDFETAVIAFNETYGQIKKIPSLTHVSKKAK